MSEYPPMRLPCGGIAYIDNESTCYSYRCGTCFAVVGSMGMARSCKEEIDKYDLWKKLGGVGWDYKNGESEKRKVK